MQQQDPFLKRPSVVVEEIIYYIYIKINLNLYFRQINHFICYDKTEIFFSISNNVDYSLVNGVIVITKTFYYGSTGRPEKYRVFRMAEHQLQIVNLFRFNISSSLNHSYSIMVRIYYSANII